LERRRIEMKRISRSFISILLKEDYLNYSMKATSLRRFVFPSLVCHSVPDVNLVFQVTPLSSEIKITEEGLSLSPTTTKVPFPYEI